MRVRVGMWYGRAMGDLRGGGMGLGRWRGAPWETSLAPCMDRTMKPSDMHPQRGASEASTHLCAWRTRRAKARAIWGREESRMGAPAPYLPTK